MTARSRELIVVGAGHAGLEAALAAARMGARVALVTLDARAVARMSCNPAIGGLGKGQIVREIDALGGEMARAADACGIQFRLLNTRKGPAVRAPRAQCDKHRYQERMARVAAGAPGLEVIEGRVEALALGPDPTAPCGRVEGVVLAGGTLLRGHAVVLTNGTFLRGLLHCGEERSRGGRVGEDAAYGLSDFLEDVGFERGRLKTGTPPRVDASTVDFSLTVPQPGDDPPVPFSHFTREIPLPQVVCHITWTNEEVHELIRANLHRAPMYTGQIEGTGPRYCPSIEDKVVRFAAKERHQVFLEPEGLDTSWVYLNGISTSLPRDVQDGILRAIPALSRARVLQYGYAVEYDFFPPTQIQSTFETRLVSRLYLAGQICGTSGYEEAAAQGFLAGVNAVLARRGEEPLVLDRAQAYMGVLADDLVTACPREPYRMFTSRAEYRLLLRSDNADLRLMEIGHRLGLVPPEAVEKVARKRETLRWLSGELEVRRAADGKSLKRLLRQPGRRLRDVLALDSELAGLGFEPEVQEAVEVQVKYEAYIQRQLAQVERFRKMESCRLPPDIDYRRLLGLRAEAREKLERVRPRSLGQATRIAGVTPGDVAVLVAHLEGRRAGGKGAFSRASPSRAAAGS